MSTALFTIIVSGLVVILTLVMFSWIRRMTGGANETSPPLAEQAVAKKAKTTPSGPSIRVLFGSQSGTAESFAQLFAQQARRHKFTARVSALSDYNFESELSKEKIVVLLMATYAEGEPTDDATEFYEWIMDPDCTEDLSLTLPQSTKFSMFALGSKAYKYYCKIGIDVDRRLRELGAQPFFGPGLGDDEKNISEDFVHWSDGVWNTISTSFGQAIDPKSLTEPLFELKETGEMNASPYPWRIVPGRVPLNDRPFLSRVLSNEELCTPDSNRNCRYIEFDIDGAGIRYQAGDHLGLYAPNPPTLIEDVAKFFGIDNLDRCFSMQPAFELEEGEQPPFLPFTLPTTYRQVLTFAVDLTGPVRLNVLRMMAALAEDPTDKEALERLTDQANPEVTEERINVVEILNAHPSINISFVQLLEQLPANKPRFYSIASSSKVCPKSIKVVAMLVDYKTPKGKHIKGLATNHLINIDPTSPDAPMIPIFTRFSKFRLPRNPRTPIVMIGPGTGVAPFVAFLEERELLDPATRGESMLFFGCRRRDQDFIMGERLEEFQKTGVLNHLVLAFSRQDPEKKHYVQHEMKRPEVASTLLQMMSPAKRGVLYVCGDASDMAKDVHNTLFEILEEQAGMSPEKAAQCVAEWEKKGRYLTDTWV